MSNITKPSTRAEGDDAPDDAPEKPAPADTISSECAACGLNNDQDAKYCKGCGGSMATKAEDPPPDAPEKKPPPAAPPAASASAKPTARTYATVAAACGLREGASVVAVRTAVVRMRQSLDRSMALTGARTVDELDGHITALAEDAKRLAKVEGDMRAMKDRADQVERRDLLRKLAAANLPGFARGDLFVDDVNEETGTKTTNPAPAYAEMNLGTLRGFVSAKLANGAPAPKRSPFEPNAEKVKAEQGAPVAAATADRDREMAERLSFNADPKQVAAARAALFPNTTQRGA